MFFKQKLNEHWKHKSGSCKLNTKLDALNWNKWRTPAPWIVGKDGGQQGALLVPHRNTK